MTSPETILATVAMAMSLAACSLTPKVEVVKVCDAKTQIVRVDGVLSLRQYKWGSVFDTPISRDADVSTLCGGLGR